MPTPYIYVPTQEAIMKVNQQTGDEYVLEGEDGVYQWTKIPQVVESKVEIPNIQLLGGRN